MFSNKQTDRVESGEMSLTWFEHEKQREKTIIPVKHPFSRKPKIKTLKDFKLMLRKNSNKNKHNRHNRIKLKNQTNKKDFKVELGAGESYKDAEIVVKNLDQNPLHMRRRMGHEDFRRSRPMLRKSKLAEIYELIRKRYHVKAFLFTFVKRCP